MGKFLSLIVLGCIFAPISCNSTTSRPFSINTVSTAMSTGNLTVTESTTITTTQGQGTTKPPAQSNETCSANNGTCNVTTLSPIATQNEEDNMKWKLVELAQKESYYKFKTSNRSGCHCDLQSRFCDINCCCDKDCSSEAKNSFSFCEDAHNLPSPNMRYCNYMQYIYNNRTLHEVEVKQSSLFCIVKTNLPAHYYKQHRKIIANPLNANEVIKKSPVYQWANNQPKPKMEFYMLNTNFTNHSAIFGDQIFVLRNYSKPQPLEIPDNFVSPDCIVTKEIKYLQNTKRSCRQLMQFQNQNNKLLLQYYQANLTVLSSMKFLNNSLENYEGCPKNICIPLNIKQCDLISCRNITKDIKSECTSKHCTNIVTSVNYNFIHNGTRGIQQIDLHLTLNNISLSNANAFIEQQQEVKFLWTNQSEFNYSDYRSGNPGYQIGKPILIGKLITVFNTTTNSTTNKTTTTYTQNLQRNHGSYIENFLVFPKNINGKCVLSNFTYENVEFGYQMLTKCVHGQGFIRKANMTHNETCHLLQNNILAYWSLDVEPHPKNKTVNSTFGHFGNAQNTNLNNWGYFLFDVYPQELLEATAGRGIANNNIECQNISTGIRYNIFYERIEDEQNRIAAVYIEFASVNRVQLNVFNNNVFSDVQLTSEVMFYDVTGVRNMKYVDPPSMDIKLPYDFFYPFVKVDNAATAARSVNALDIICLMSLFVFL